jgi:hypothetical protein
MPKPTLRFSGPGNPAPFMSEELYETGQAIKIGSVLIRDGTSGELEVAANNPVTGIVGVSGADAGTYPGQEVGHASQVIATTASRQAVSFLKVHGRKIRFAAVDVNTVAPVAATHVGVDYALVLNSGIWNIDVADETNVAALIVDVDEDLGLYIFEFLSTVTAE